jgi:predicted LPLAT superfamily acyltransferase
VKLGSYTQSEGQSEQFQEAQQAQTKDQTNLDSLHWQNAQERGGSVGLLFLLWVQKILGRPILSLILYPVLIYFFVTGKQARNASRQYLQRLQAWTSNSQNQTISWRMSLRHFMDFAWTVADKIDAWSGNITHEHVEVMQPDTLRTFLADPRGALIIGAHMGNPDVLRAVYQTEGSPYYQGANLQQHQVNVIMDTAHTPIIHRVMLKHSRNFETNLVQAKTVGPDTALAWRDKVEKGDWLFILGDRTAAAQSENTTTVDFLGHPAPWPTGPWVLAHILECPVYFFLCVKTRTRFGRPHYRLYLEQIADKINLPRKTRHESMQAYVRQYVQRLEQQCQETPTQWFNFYDFWNR